jgi:hypothetical protein
MRNRWSSLIMVFALLVCPVVCFGGWLGHEDDGNSPTDGGEHRSCVEHPCICAGATIPTTDHAVGATACLPIAVLPVASFTDRVSLIVGAHTATFSSNPDPPDYCRVLPLLI